MSDPHIPDNYPKSLALVRRELESRMEEKHTRVSRSVEILAGRFEAHLDHLRANYIDRDKFADALALWTTKFDGLKEDISDLRKGQDKIDKTITWIARVGIGVLLAAIIKSVIK